MGIRYARALGIIATLTLTSAPRVFLNLPGALLAVPPIPRHIGHRGGPGAPPYDGRMSESPRYLTLDAARALECNGCGDCCDSRRTDGHWTWGTLPTDQYRPLFDGRPLIIPLTRIETGWADRAHEASDAGELSATRFRCEAFEPHEDGTGGCGIHTSQVPSKCREFPVWGTNVEADLEACGEHALATSAFPRCTWFQMTVVGNEDSRVRSAAD